MKSLKYFFYLLLIIESSYYFIFANPTLILREPVKFQETFINTEKTRLKNFISYAEFYKDIDYLFYYLKTAYAGYDELLKNGFSEEKFREYFKKKYENSEEIETRTIMKEFTKLFSEFAIDNHLYIAGNNAQTSYSASSSAKFYYTNTFVQKDENYFYVTQTDSSNIKAEAKFTGNNENLFYYPAKGKNSYRLGIISKKKISDHNFSFDGMELNIPVHDDGNIQISFSQKYHEIETTDSVYISLSSFYVHENDSKFKTGSEIILKKFADAGKTWQNKKNIIIDLRSNTGGEISYGIYPFYAMTKKNPANFSFKNLKKMESFLNDIFFEQNEYYSPATAQSNLKYNEKLIFIKKTEWKKIKKFNRKMLKTPEKLVYSRKCDFSKEIKTFFNGKVIFLMDRNSYSASELSPLAAKRILGNKVKIIGENSAGCIQYGSIYTYLLPNSGISISLGNKKNTLLNHFENWHGEQYGIFPDYWSLGCDLNETIFLETNDSEMKEKLKNIEFRLL